MSIKTKEESETVQNATHKLRLVQADLAFRKIDMFGDKLAKREKYKEHQGIDAVHFYLIQKYHWLPKDVRSLNWDDLLFLLAEESPNRSVHSEVSS